MFTVLECVAIQHDRAVVLLAAVICLLGMFAFFTFCCVRRKVRPAVSPIGCWLPPLPEASASGPRISSPCSPIRARFRSVMISPSRLCRRFSPLSVSGWRSPPARRPLTALSSSARSLPCRSPSCISSEWREWMSPPRSATGGGRCWAVLRSPGCLSFWPFSFPSHRFLEAHRRAGRIGDFRHLRAAFHDHVGHGAFAGSVRIRA